MADWITVQGTKSDAGKSLVTTKLIEILSENHSVAPFKPVNFSRNSFPVLNSEIGYSTFHQARKAGVEPEKIMAPVLVKPMDKKTELIAENGVEKTSYKNLDQKTGEKYGFIEECIEHLDRRFDYVVWEGFGSMINSNLENNPNIDFLEKTGAKTILVGDISEGGVEAQLKGTHELLPEKFSKKISVNIINKASKEAENISKTESFVEKHTDTKTVSLPYIENLNFPEEDGKPDFSGADSSNSESALSSNLNENAAGNRAIAVINYPHMSNTSDFELLPKEKTLLVEKPSELENSDLIILPGSKNTLKDLEWMKERNLDEKILEKSSEAVVFGVCGGFQMLGEEISGNGIEEGEKSGLGLVEMKTDFSREKTLERVNYSFNGEDLTGYCIHYGESDITDENLFEISSRTEGYFENGVGGTYIHDSLRNQVFLQWLLAEAGIEAEFSGSSGSELKRILREEVEFL
ncbi:MAG: cobyric acid synthase [Candidatus Nanosalina sp.]